MSFEDYFGYCPISNPNTNVFNLGLKNKVPTQYLGYEVLANSNIRQYGSQELQELNHELLTRLYTIKTLSDYSIIEAVIVSLQGYLKRSIEEKEKGTSVRIIDDNSFSILIINNHQSKTLILALKQYLLEFSKTSYPLLEQLSISTFIFDQCIQLQLLLRKIEYLSYYTLVSIQKAIFVHYNIKPRYHQQLIDGTIEQTSTGDYIASCFRPFNHNINFGLNSISFDHAFIKIDKFLTNQLPTLVERTHLPIIQEETIVISKFKEILHLSPVNITNPFTSELKDGDVEGMIALEVFALVTLLCWKSGLAWVPILGSLVPYLDDGPLGRLLGVTVALTATGFLTQNNIIQLRFVPQALFATNTTRTISILFLGLMLGGIFAI